MTYRAYIKKDYKAVIRQEPDHPVVAGFLRLSLVSSLLVIPWLLLGMKAPAPTAAPQPLPISAETSIQSQIIKPLTVSNNPAKIAVPLLENDDVETAYPEMWEFKDD